jgi:class 3 adenylate cyclase
VGREIENWSLRREMEQLEGYRRLIASHTDNKFSPPTGDVAIIFTDIQGSTALWEADASAMQAALALHDDIMRKCCAASHGYEIRTEGDAFHVAFHDSLDAISFALKTQAELHNAPWSNDILSLPDAAEKDGFRGLRVRMAIHYGPAHQHTNEVSRRQEYHGETVYIAKSIEAMTQGGQILVTHDAWCGASYLADTKLGSPQVIDLGEHVLLTGKTKKDGFIAKQILQLLPSSLAFDYFGQHRATEEESEHSHRPSERWTLTGRRFPPIKSERRLSTSFHDAPCASSTVTMVFVHTYDLEQAYDDPAIVLAALAKLIGTLLMEQGQGYQCKNTMIAFKCQSSAVRFGLALIDALTRRRIDGKDLSRLIKVGIFEGKFTSMGPHQTTGRADYYGPVVNRAARVAGAAEPGQVCLGVVTADRPELMADLETEFIGEKQLKGLQEAVSLYSCRKV